MGKLIDLTGRVFGRLTVLQRDGSTSRGFARWLCQCECGKQVTVIGISLRSGGANSCKCQNRERLIQQNKDRSLPPEVSNQNRLLGRYKLAAQKRGLKWGLTDPEFGVLVKGTCFYCGVDPQQIFTHPNSISLSYNGVDRLDNLQGYDMGNCVSCCGVCNYMKCKMTVEEFYNHIDRIIFCRKMRGETKCQLAATA